uniref:Uncharacterized protein n=1 Tax=Ditylenchus dipsaci TaxID=166011 RepID=A0A915D340_9BILA
MNNRMSDRTEEVKTPFRRTSSIRQYGNSAMSGIGVRNSTNNIPLPVCVSDLIFLVDIPGEEENTGFHHLPLARSELLVGWQSSQKLMKIELTLLTIYATLRTI